jgi:hypothetical protein
VKNVQKVLDGKTGACQNGLTDRRNSDGQASKCFKSSKKALDAKSKLCETGLTDSSSTGSTARAAKKFLTGKSRCAKLASLNETRRQAANQAKKCLTAETKRVKLAALNKQTNPGTARRASLKEHYHDCNHQKRPG